MKTNLFKFRYRTVFCILFTCILAGGLAYPQAVSAESDSVVQQVKTSVWGTVMDKDGEPLAGVSVSEKGTTNATMTDIDGKFSLSVSSQNAVLIFSYVGFKPQEASVKGKESLTVKLLEDQTMLDDVVVIGYGTQRKGDVTSAITSVKPEDFAAGRIGDASDLIKGKVAGLNFTKSSGDPNATSSIMLRGATTLKGTVEPLVLVDGIEGSLTTVTPENIASIDVLKDASAAAIYGTRGANGVIIITTKSGKRESRSEISYAGNISLSNWYKKADFMDTHDIIYGKTNFPYDGYDTDWLDAISRKGGYRQNHSLSMSGGSTTFTYSANVTYNDEEGIMRNSDNRNLRAQLDISQYAFDDIVKFNVNILHNDHKNTNNDNNYAYRQALIRNPSSPIYGEDGSYMEDFNRLQYYNPVAIQNERIGDTRSSYTKMIGNVSIEPIKGWVTNLMASLYKYNSTDQDYYTSQYYSQKKDNVKGSANKSSANTRHDNIEITSRYEFSIQKHRISVLGGYSYLYKVNDRFDAGNRNFPTEVYLYNNLGQGTYLTDKDHHASMSSYKNDSKLVGFFGRVSYGYDNRYNLLASFRHEGSSKFGANHKWGTFPSVSLGWTASNEAFMKDFTWLDHLKLRAGFGVTGQDPRDPYVSLDRWDFNPYGKHLNPEGGWSPSLQIKQNPNPDMKWEKTQEFNIGLDWNVLDGRLGGAIDYYFKRTKDLLYDYNVPVPPNMHDRTQANVGVMDNQGIEIMINAIPVRTKDFEYNTTLTLSHNKNKLVSLSNNLYETANFREEGNAGDPISVPTHAMEVGKRLGDFWGLKSAGVSKDGFVLVEVSDGNGGWILKEFDPKYNDISNRQRLGNGMPDIYAGWNHTFRYKDFDLSLQFTGQFGFQILNAQRAFYENNSIAYNRLKSAADFHGAIDANRQPVIDPATGKQQQVQLASSMQQGVWSDHIEDGDFVKLSNVTIGYTIPFKGKAFKYIKNARVYASGQNLFCITGYSGLDPEVPNPIITPGVDSRDKYPTVRTFTFGVNFNF